MSAFIAVTDFSPLDTEVNLQTDSNQCRTISIREDNCVESLETFQVLLLSHDPAVNIVGATATVAIIDTTSKLSVICNPTITTVLQEYNSSQLNKYYQLLKECLLSFL